MTGAPRDAPSAAIGTNSGSGQLATLVQQIGSILAQRDDSGTPTHNTELRSKLIFALLRLLDVGVSSHAQVSASRELAAVLQLLKLTLEKVPEWLTSGDLDSSALFEILERLLPVLSRRLDVKLLADTVEAVSRILQKIAETGRDQLISLVDTLSNLFLDVFTTALALSFDPTNTATITVKLNNVGDADSNHQHLELPMTSTTPCEQVLQVTLRSLSDIMTIHPQLTSMTIPTQVVHGACRLLSSNSLSLQASAMKFLVAVIRAQSRMPAALHLLPDRLSSMISSIPAHFSACSINEIKVEHSLRLTAMLQTLNDVSTGGCVTKQVLLAMTLSAIPSASCDEHKDMLCDLVSEIIAVDPRMLETNPHAMVYVLLPQCSSASRKRVLHAIKLYFDSLDESCIASMPFTVEWMNDARHTGTSEIPLHGNAHNDSAEPNKRRRLTASAGSESQQYINSNMDVDNSHPGFKSVVSAIMGLIHDLEAQASSSQFAVDVLGDITFLLAPLMPDEAASWALRSVKKWEGWGALQFGGRALPEQQIQAGLKLLSAALYATTMPTCSIKEKIKASFEDWIGTSLLSCVRGEGPGSNVALVAALLASILGMKDFIPSTRSLSSNADHLVDIFEAARSKHFGVQFKRAYLAPVAACVAGLAPMTQSSTAIIGSGGGKKSKASGGAKQAHSTPLSPSINPLKVLLNRISKSTDSGVIEWLIRGIHTVMYVFSATEGNEDNFLPTLVRHSVFSALQLEPIDSMMISSSLSRSPITSHRVALPLSIADWLRPLLDIITTVPDPPAPDSSSSKSSGPLLVEVVACFLYFVPDGEREHCKPLAKWLIRQARANNASVRVALLRQASILATPQIVITLHHDGPFPTTHAERASLATNGEHSMIAALKDEISPVERCDPQVVEDALHLIANVGIKMKSQRARMYTLAIFILTLDQKDAGVSATAAECLRSIARHERCTVKELILSTPRLMEHIGKQLPNKPILLQELADLLGMSTKALALTAIPIVLPQLCSGGQQDSIRPLKSLATQANITVQKMFQDYGHHALASSLMHSTPPMEKLITLYEEMTGLDFGLLATAAVHRTVTEIVAQTGCAKEWSTGGASMPEEVVHHTSRMLAVLASTQAAGGENEEGGAGGSSPTYKTSTSEFLAQGDHVTRMLKEFGDELEKRLATDKGGLHASTVDVFGTLNVLRRILVLIRLTGPFVGRFLPQFMVLLGAAIRPNNHQDIKLQALVGWQLLIEALSKEAPVQLGGIVNQVVVTLLDRLQESGPVVAGAARVVEGLISACQTHYPQKIPAIPPLPLRIAELRHVNVLLSEARGEMDTQEHVELLLEGLRHEALSVRSTALQELRDVMMSRRDWVASLAKSNPNFHIRVLGALLKAAEPASHTPGSLLGQQACAECLGILGAVDPSRVNLRPPKHSERVASEPELAVELLTKHLVRLLKTAPNLQTLDSTTLAIQEVLRCHASCPMLLEIFKKTNSTSTTVNRDENENNTMSDSEKGATTKQMHQRATTPQPECSNHLFSVLPEEIQAIVRPYLESKFHFRDNRKRIEGVVFRTNMTFRRWLALWLEKLIDEHIKGEYGALLRAIKPVLRHDIPTAMFILPYIVQIAVCYGDHTATKVVSEEILAVLGVRDGSNSGMMAASSRDVQLCMQAVFSLLDTLRIWYEDSKLKFDKGTTSSSGSGSVSGVPSNSAKTAFSNSEWPRLFEFLYAIPKNTISRAAAGCGAHARALLHFESYVRTTRGGGANPASFQPPPVYDDSEVSFLLQVYSKLEEPDGLEGFMKLRQGGPRLEDQRHAAEMAGSWGEALTLYERDLAHLYNNTNKNTNDNTSLSSSEEKRIECERGYLNCMLHMGHWQGLMAQVDGMTSSSSRHTNEAPLAAMGAAAAWRMGRWERLEGYLATAEQGFHSLSSDERWEARIGQLLKTAAKSTKSSSSVTNDLIFKELQAARSDVMGPFSAAAMESYSRAYPHLVKLHMLQEMSDVVAIIGKGAKERKRALKWDERMALTQYSFATQGPILALRRQLASIIGATEEAGKCWLSHAQLCRSTGHYDAAVPAVLEAISASIPGASFERVQLLYDRGERHRAISELRILESGVDSGQVDGIYRLSDTDKARYRGRLLLRLAEWTAESGQGTREEVTALFDEALKLRPSWDTGLFKYAAYLDEIMQDARARQEQPTNGAFASNGTMTRACANNALDRLGGKSRIKLGEDRHHLNFLPEVMKNYGLSVQSGSRHIYRSLYRLLTIWFEFGSNLVSNPPQTTTEKLTADNVMQLMKNFRTSIPSHCWFIGLPQLVSRICHRHAEVASITRHIIIDTTKAYPYQALWQLTAVSKSSVNSRKVTARQILNQARQKATADESRIYAEQASVSDSLVNLINNTKDFKRRKLSAMTDYKLSSFMRSMPKDVLVPVMAALNPTLPPAGMSYSSASSRGWRPFPDAITIHDLKDEIELMPSMQKPKKIIIIGSDGNEYPLLAKPKDDLRKDCRMMEVAGVVNKLFEDDASSRRRHLYIRQFAVVPTTDDTGLVEWVNNTRTMRSCINAMLEETSPNACKQMVATVGASHKKLSEKGRLVQWLEETVKSYPPTFHRWMMSRWSEPASWLNARLQYTRTYAVWCMVGHIAGLGDRHGDNVLIDTQSGDALQIDFGCLFDKGLTLAMPEMVPFRLTQNVIDGFGVAGVEGVYRKTCETTLSVLRNNKDTIISVMDTFVHDPLVEWADGEKKALAAAAASGQNAGSTRNLDGGNPHAQDALSTIEGRIRGTLLGVKATPCMPLSIEGHVDALIQESTSRENLSRMYIWWQPWY